MVLEFTFSEGFGAAECPLRNERTIKFLLDFLKQSLLSGKVVCFY